MNDRQRFCATMHSQPRNRAPICDFGFWPETIDLWHRQGLPTWVTGGHDISKTDLYFGMDRYTGGPIVHCCLLPPFESKVIEDRGDHELIQQPDGVTVLRKKFMGSIPQHHAHLLQDRATWTTHYKPRLDPSSPERYPNWDQARAEWHNPNRDYPTSIYCGSLYGWLRDWMGVEQISYIVYDDPALFEEMVTTLADCAVGMLQRAFDHGAVFDSASFWEDMCYSGGPLLGPTHFHQYLVPQYRRITDLLRAHGTDIIWVDCDGKIDGLIPLWLEGGVNCMFPIEVGTWHADPVALRRTFGRELLMIGGVDKHILAGPRDQIEAEVRRLAPLVEEGGYIPTPDHRVPPDVPFANYLHYLRHARQIWGQGVNLKSVQWPHNSHAPADFSAGSL